MADSTEDLKRQMEEFERGEAPVQAGALGEPPAPAGRRKLPAWVLPMITADIVIVGAIVVVLLA